jgi:hypothetical protein
VDRAFVAAGRRAVDDAAAFEQRVIEIEKQWRTALGRVRSGSAVERLLTVLPGVPIISVNRAADVIGRSFQATNQAMHRLEEARSGPPGHNRTAHRAYEAGAILDAFTALERQLASATANTAAARPQRAALAPPLS